MIRILHVFHEMNNGGIEHFVMDYYRHIDRSQVQFDFLTSVDREGYFDKEILALGGRLFRAYPLKKNPIRCFFDIASIIKKNNYSIIHRHTGSAFGYFDLRAAKHGGARHLIMHSHNNRAGNTALHYICNLLFRVKCEKLACSKEAGEWLFGKKAAVKVINNAIDGKAFQYQESSRQKIRAELDVSDKFVVGHIGRFEDQKNHRFLLDIFEAVAERKKNAVLVLVGDGSLLEGIRREAKAKGILDRIIFMGTQKETAKLYNMFDVFVLPSKYEGFGITLLEAQTNGLHCYTSAHVVPQTVNISGNIKYISLEESPEKWAEEITEGNCREVIGTDVIKQAGFDISENAKQLLAYYKTMI